MPREEMPEFELEPLPELLQGPILPAPIDASGSLGSFGAALADHSHPGVATVFAGDEVLQGDAEFAAGIDMEVEGDADAKTITYSLPAILTQDYEFTGTITMEDLNIHNLTVDTIESRSLSPAGWIDINANLDILGNTLIDGILYVDTIGAASASPAGDIDFLTNIVMPDDSWIGLGPADARWIFDSSPAISQIELASGALMIGDAQRIFFEAVGTTQGTESIWSGANGLMHYAAATSHNFDTLIELVATTATAGQITQAGTRVFHTYGTNGLFFGLGAGNFTLTGVENLAVGEGVLGALTTGRRNVGVGYLALAACTGGNSNVALGRQALGALTTGSFNMGIGYRALLAQIIGVNCVGIGFEALFSCTGNNNVAVGYDAGRGITSGSNNMAIGRSSMSGGNCSFSVAVGTQACRLLATSYTIGIGYRALYNATAGARITAIGRQAGFTGTTFDDCVFIGNQAGYWETGSDKLFIDNDARTNEADGRVKALVYGEFNAATASQLFRLNAALEVRHNASLMADAQIDGTLYVDIIDAASASPAGVVDIVPDLHALSDIYALGLIDLVATTATAGQITQAGTRILHTYGPAGHNLFAGATAGNFTLTSGDCVGLGWDVLGALTSANFATAAGAYALTNLTSGHNCTAYGVRAGQTLTTATGAVMLGGYAGYWESGSNKLFIDNATRLNEADGRVMAMIYGVFAATTAAQHLYFNANVYISEQLFVDTILSREGSPSGPLTLDCNTDIIGDLQVSGCIYTDCIQPLESSPTGAIRIGDGGFSDFLTIGADGDVLFFGNSGFAFGEIWVRDNVAQTVIGVAGTYVQFVGFGNNGSANNTRPDHTQDHITIDHAGIYEVICSLHIESIGGGGADLIEYEIRTNTGTTIYSNLHGQRNLTGGGGDSGSVSLSGLAVFSEGDTVEVWITDDDNPTNVIVDDANLTVIQVGGT